MKRPVLQMRHRYIKKTAATVHASSIDICAARHIICRYTADFLHQVLAYRLRFGRRAPKRPPLLDATSIIDDDHSLLRRSQNRAVDVLFDFDCVLLALDFFNLSAHVDVRHHLPGKALKWQKLRLFEAPRLHIEDA